MNTEYWLYLIIGLVVFNYLFSTVLDFINDKNWKDEIPPVMKDYYDEEKYVKAKNYAKEKGRISLNFKHIKYCNYNLFFIFEGYGWLDSNF